MNSLTLKFKFNIDKSDIEDTTEALIDDMKTAIEASIQDNIDTHGEYSWVESGGPLSASGASGGRAIISQPNSTPRKVKTVFESLYQDLWRDRYEKLQAEFKSEAQGPGSEEYPNLNRTYEEFLDWKKANEGKPAPWSGQTIGQFYNTDYAIMTGTLKKRPMQVFESMNNNEYFEMDNPMLRGAWRHNVESYEHSGFNHVVEISQNYFIGEYNIYDEISDITNFASAAFGIDQVSKIADKMEQMLERHFKPDLIKKLNDIEVT